MFALRRGGGGRTAWSRKSRSFSVSGRGTGSAGVVVVVDAWRAGWSRVMGDLIARAAVRRGRMAFMVIDAVERSSLEEAPVILVCRPHHTAREAKPGSTD